MKEKEIFASILNRFALKQNTAAHSTYELL
jgi:hypothetical protein